MGVDDGGAMSCRSSDPWPNVLRSFTYRPDEEPKQKHHWTLPTPGFIKVDGEWVGKCPEPLGIDPDELLDKAFPLRHKRDRRAYPRELWCVHEGVPYRALPWGDGCTYHGFPAHAGDWRNLPKGFRRRLERQADAEGTLEELHKWLANQPRES